MSARRLRNAALAIAVALGAAIPAAAVETRLHAEDGGSLARGDADRIAVTRAGRLFLAPRLSRLSGATWDDAPAHVWSMAATASGSLYLGTGPEGRVLEITPSGRIRQVYRVEEPMVTALAVLGDGTLLAGTAPEGRIYRIAPDGRGAVWAETETRYVWSLAAGPNGNVYAGTGEEGLILEIDRKGNASAFFDTEEPHVVSLALHPDGGLLAGGSGRGLLYRIDDEGNGLVIHDDELPEVTAIAVQPDRSIVLALLAPPPADPRRPLVRIQLPQGARGPGGDGVSELDDDRTAIVEGSIEGLPMPSDAPSAAVRGRVVRVSADEHEVDELWRSSSEAPFALGRDAAGRVLFGTGEPARVYRVERDGDVARLVTLREAQVTTMVDAGGWIGLATSNPAATYRLDGVPAESGVFVSRPIDAGAPARWGTIRWHEEGDPARVELYTRTGNSEVPDGTWSGWSPALTAPAGSPVVNPDGRFLQWRARILGRDRQENPASRIEVSYAPHNRAPRILGFRLDSPLAAVAEQARFRFSTTDPDGDPVVVEVRYRPAAGGEWLRAIDSDPVKPYDDGPASWKDGRITWDTSAIPEGRYEIRAFASDHPANHPGEGRRTLADERLLVAIDRTPPTVAVTRAADGTLEVVAKDAQSAVRQVELVREERARFTARPMDGVADGAEERFRIAAGDVPGDGWSVRVTDAAGNTAEEPLSP